MILGPNESWDISAKVGAERVQDDLGHRGAEIYEASIRRVSNLNRIHIQYRHRSGYQIGLDRLNRYHGITGYFDQQLGSHLTMHLLSRFYRTSTDTYGNVDTLGGGAGLDYAVHPSFALTIFGHYLFQQTGSSPFSPEFRTDRYIIYAGLHYLFPSVKRESRGARGRVR